jgi:hypothetical protein
MSRLRIDLNANNSIYLIAIKPASLYSCRAFDSALMLLDLRLAPTRDFASAMIINNLTGSVPFRQTF